MGAIQNIEKISNAIGDTTIMVLPKRCIYIRNWNSSCRACLNACPHDAIRRSLGRLSIDFERCTNCGACAQVCPASAFITTAPTAGALVSQVRRCATEMGNHAVFACARLDEDKKLDHAKVCILPCLDYLDEYLISGLFACGIKSVNLIDYDCEKCPLAGPSPVFKKTVSNVKMLLKSWQVDGIVRILDKIPIQIASAGRLDFSPISGAERRNALRSSAKSTLDIIVKEVTDRASRFDSDLAKKKHEAEKQITVALEERFAPDTYRSVRMLAMLNRLGELPSGQIIQSRLWADVKIDPSACKACGMCAKMCPTRALKYEGDDKQDNARGSASCGTLTFEPAQCIACRLCKDSCLTHSMIYTNRVLSDDLSSCTVKVLFEHRMKATAHVFGR